MTFKEGSFFEQQTNPEKALKGAEVLSRSFADQIHADMEEDAFFEAINRIKNSK